jgi:hypothetical protein
MTAKHANLIKPSSHVVINLTKDANSEIFEAVSPLGSFDVIDLTQDDDGSPNDVIDLTQDDNDGPNNVIDLTQDNHDSPKEKFDFVSSIGNATLERILCDEEAFSDESDSEYEEWLADIKRKRRYRPRKSATPDSPVTPDGISVDWLRNSSCEPDASDNDSESGSDTSSVDDFNKPDKDIGGLIAKVDKNASYCMKGDKTGDWELDYTGNYFINIKTDEQCRKSLRIARGEGYFVENV